jgi:hypothetical protein
MSKPIPNVSQEEEDYLDNVLDSSEKLLELRADAAEQTYVSIEASSMVYIISRYRSLMGRGNLN